MTRREALVELFRDNAKPLVFPMVVADHAAKLSRRKLGKVVTSGELLAKSLLKAYSTYEYDAILVFADTMVEAEAMGCTIKIPENDNPSLVSSLGMDNVKPVTELNLKSRIPVVLDATRAIVKEVGRDVPVFTSLKGPFSLASFLVGTEDFLTRLRAEPISCRKVLRYALKHQQLYVDAIVAAGGIPFIGEPLASGDVISRRDFETFVLPFARDLIDYAGSVVRPIGLHVCGDTSDRVVLLRDTGADILSVDNVELAFARRKAGNDTVLMGNVPTDLILQGPAEKVLEAARTCLKDAGPRFILSSACDIPRDTPAENVKAIVEAARESAFADEGRKPKKARRKS
jgi:uroporphyrinogen decarboxylase